MVKWADYLISHIWTDDNGTISHVLLHRDLKTSISDGAKRSEQYVIDLIEKGFDVCTILWNYNQAGYIKGAKVEVVVEKHNQFLRTHKDAEARDNLKNLPWLKY